jgi:methylenetetrahydrofolate--tRNA-(uracil-5-)-methyltransferase
MQTLEISPYTMMGALFHFISTAEPKYFQPMPPNFGILAELPTKIKGKPERYGAYRDRSLCQIDQLAIDLGYGAPQPITN